MILRGNIKKLINKSRESALLAVEIYNNPNTVFKTYSYIVNICIAWTALFHAIFEKRKIKYFYRNDKNTKYIKIDGEPKAWDLSTCCKEYYKDIMTPSRANLETIMKLRNKIEHRFLAELDSHVFGECQSCLFNYERLITSEFGNENGINCSLALALQFSEVYDSSQINSMKKMKAKEIKRIQSFLDEYRKGYDEDIVDSIEYSFKVFVLPKLGNNISSSDQSIEFIKRSEISDEQYEQIKNNITLVKEKRIPVSNDNKMKAGEVVKKVNERVDFEFKMHQHTYCWKYFNVRPICKSKNPEIVDSRYCSYDSLHNDYVYTTAWVEKLVKELSKEDVKNAIFNSKGIK